MMDNKNDSSHLDKDLSKAKKKESSTPKKSSSSGLAKLASKVKRKSSLRKDRPEKKPVDDPVLSSTDDNLSSSDQPLSPTDSGLPSSPPMSGPVLVSLSKIASKSEDSLDSGIYSRQKSCDSVDSIGSSESSGNTDQQLRPVMSYSIARDNPHSNEDYSGGHPIGIGRYDDYWREYQEIRQSIIVHDDDIEERRIVARSDSGEDDDVSDWIRQAGFVGLVSSASLASDANSSGHDSSGNSGTRLSTDSLTSMTILNTLTEPQRKAVLRRITSFNNRAQKSKRRPIHGIFSSSLSAATENVAAQEGAAAKPPSGMPQIEVTTVATNISPGTDKSKSTSLPYTLPNHELMTYQHRRYSEVTHRPVSTSFVDTESHGQYSLASAYSTSSLDMQPDLKIDRKGYQRKDPLHAIVATESTGGIETLSVQSRSTDDTWPDSFSEDQSSKTKQAVSYSETADQESLPNFSLVKDRLGITRISDLSPLDIQKVQSLALIELTALFDLHGIDLKRRKFGKVKTKETGLFGIPLTTLLEWDQKRLSDDNLRVPFILQEAISYLEKNGLSDEGILRVPGSVGRIKNLTQELENKFGQSATTSLLDPNAGWDKARANDVAALLKQFLRELPNPLLTLEYIDAFQSCDLIPDRKQQLQALNLLIILLNKVHRDSLKLLLKFLSRVVAKEEKNKMSLNNVAMIMAPNLFMARKQSKRGEPIFTASQDVKHAAGTSNIVRMLIKYHKLLWTVPTFMLTQVRKMNQAEQSSKKHHTSQTREKLRIKFPVLIKTKDPQSKVSKSPLAQGNEQFNYEVPKGVIRVLVENHSMTSMAVQLDPQCTAGDVIAKFQKQCERAKQMSPDSDIVVITNDTHALCEVGGNIFERCLDPGTNMHALTKINPEASWVIKKRTNT